MRASDRIRDQLETEILRGDLQEGARLDESSLAQRFDVSRTPVREALTALAVSGLIDNQPNRGCTVKLNSPDRILEKFELMAALESSCARLAATRISRAQAQELKKLMSDCEKAANSDDPDEYYYCNERFHACIFDSSTNRALADTAQREQSFLKPYRRLQLQVHNRMTTSLREHQQIVDAILSGDETRAAEAMWSHVLVQASEFSRYRRA